MTKIRTLQILRGTTVQNDAYTGSVGELTMDTTTNELRLHDGSTAGGYVIGSGKSIDADIVGTLTIASNGDVSGFSLNDYLKLPADIDFSTSTFEIDCAFTATNISSAIIALGRRTIYGIQIWKNLNDDKIQAEINTQTLTGTTSLLANTKYFVKLTSDGVNYTLSLSTDGTNYVQEATAAISDTPKLDNYRLGRSSPDTMLHMSNYRIKQNGIVVWNGLDAAGLHQRVAKGHEVIEFQAPTAENNYTWYRKYADGWVEQGGITATTSGNPASVTYPVVMSDSNYTLNVSAQTPQATSASTIHGCHYVAKETTRCTIVCLAGNSGGWIAGNISWQVSGMAAN